MKSQRFKNFKQGNFDVVVVWLAEGEEEEEDKNLSWRDLRLDVVPALEAYHTWEY